MARITRLDKFIDALIDGKTDDLPPPLSRLERELYEGIMNRKPETPAVTSWNDLEDKPFNEESESVFRCDVWRHNAPTIYELMSRMEPLDFVVEGETYTLTPKERPRYELPNGLGVWGYYVGNPTKFNLFPEDGGTFEVDDVDFCIYIEWNDTKWDEELKLSWDGYESTAQIYETVTTVTPLDEKFMPILTAPNGTKYKIAVTNEGTITATAVV